MRGAKLEAYLWALALVVVETINRPHLLPALVEVFQLAPGTLVALQRSGRCENRRLKEGLRDPHRRSLPWDSTLRDAGAEGRIYFFRAGAGEPCGETGSLCATYHVMVPPGDLTPNGRRTVLYISRFAPTSPAGSAPNYHSKPMCAARLLRQPEWA